MLNYTGERDSKKKNPNNTNVDEGQFTYLEFSFHYISGIQSEELAPKGVQNTEGASKKKKNLEYTFQVYYSSFRQRKML